jgi:hypothetical protein
MRSSKYKVHDEFALQSIDRFLRCGRLVDAIPAIP